MQNKAYTLLNYKTLDGKTPFEDWLNNLKDRKAAAIIARRLYSQVTSGSLGDFKSIKGSEGLYEFRVHFGPGYRVYCTMRGKDVIILLCAGNKSSQDQDIKKAEGYRDEFIRREADNRSI